MASMSDPALVDEAVQKVHANAEKWAAIPFQLKLDLIEEIRLSFKTNIETYKQVCLSKRLSLTHPDGKKMIAEEEIFTKMGSLIMNAMVFCNWLYGLHSAYRNIVTTSKLPFAKYSATTIPEVTRVKVGPSGLLQRLFLPFGSIELYIKGDKKQTLPNIHAGGVSAILGAGNYDAPIDILHTLFILNRVCVYKLSPMSNALYAVFRDIFNPLISRGYLEIICGESAEGMHLCNHPLIDQVIMTGSRTTANKLYWGSPSPPLRSLALKPQMTKSFIFECGNCTPWIICPSKWSSWEMQLHTSHIAFAIVLNGGHICAHPQLLVTCRGWPQREEFLESLKYYLRKTPFINTFYSNFMETMTATKKEWIDQKNHFATLSSSAICKNDASSYSSTQNILFAQDLKPTTVLTQQEMFCAVVGEVVLDTPNTMYEFLETAVEFLNSDCEGNLCCSITAKTRAPEEHAAVTKAIDCLNYGSVLVNIMPSMSIIFPQIVWGAYAEFDPYALHSGKGHFGNCYGYPQPLKSIVRTPFVNPLLLVLSISNLCLSRRLERTLNQLCFAFCEMSHGIKNFFWMSYRFTRIGFSFVFGV